ncbi:hypothetical protein JP0148_13350 [Helicobacter pylori]
MNEVAKNHAEKSGEDLLKGVKIVTSGPTIKERTSTSKEKESRFKLDFDFADDNNAYFRIIAEAYANEKRSKRLGVLFAPMSYEGGGFQASLIILHALSYASNFKYHSDAEWNAMIENRGEDDGFFNSFDEMLMGEVTLFCKVIETYAKKLKRPDGKGENGYGVTLEEWANLLPKNKNEALFVAQLLCDGGINKYGLSCAGLTAGLLADNLGYYGLLVESDNEREAVE